MTALSYANGPSTEPLLGRDDRGEPARHGGPVRRPRGAGRRADRPALDLRRTGRATSTRWRAACWRWASAKGDRVGIWAPNVPEWVLVQYATARIGAILVNINPAYRTHELAYVLQPGRHPDAGRGRGVQDLRLPRHGRRGPPRLPRPARGRLHRDGRLGRADRPGGRRWRRRSSAEREATLASTTRSTSSTPRAPPASPRAPRCRTTTSSTTATSSPRTQGWTEAGPGLRAGAVLPLLRHGDGQPRRDHRTAPAW